MGLLKNGEFIINGVHSRDLRAVIQNRPVVPVPRRRKNPIFMPGHSGTIHMDEETYDNSPLDLNIAIYAKDFEEAEYNREQLMGAFNSEGYVPFRYYVNPHKLYRVDLEDMVFSGTRAIGYHQQVAVSLSVHPYKFTHDGLVIELENSGEQIINPNGLFSEPIIKIEGSGNVTLIVNGESFVIRNIQDHIIIHTPSEHTYRESNGLIINEDSKINTLDYPRFKEKANVISWTGNVSKVTIEPRWQTLI